MSRRPRRGACAARCQVLDGGSDGGHGAAEPQGVAGYLDEHLGGRESTTDEVIEAQTLVLGLEPRFGA